MKYVMAWDMMAVLSWDLRWYGASSAAHLLIHPTDSLFSRMSRSRKEVVMVMGWLVK